MRICFYQRLAISLVAVFMLVMIACFYSTNELQKLTQQEAAQKLHIGLAEHLVRDNPLLKEGVYDYAALGNLFHTLMILGPSFEFYYLDPQGKILTYSAEPGKVKAESVNIAPIKSLIGDNQNFPIEGDDPRQLGRQKIFSAAPVFNDDKLQGYLYVIIGGERYDSILANLKNSQSMREIALFLVVGLLLLLAALLVIFKYFTSPLQRLSDDMDKVREADFHREQLPRDLAVWNKNSYNEVDRLGCAFTDMLTHINKQFDQLSQIDSQRRTLLADLSHDLRTPLSSLQGYIETLAINDDTLSVKDRKHFIDVSLKNAKNLKHLIDQIFELAYLEGGQVTLHQEPFPLGELLHDVAAKFALDAQGKNIQISVIPNDCEYHVFADIGKLERVLTNLIANAIRHTPEFGKIDLAVAIHDEKLRVDIRDTGVGISAKEIAYIFDARYQASNTETDACSHAGLGLAICRKLMTLLNSDLKVESQLGKGTCFSFELTLVNSNALTH
ncbi:HAMP domain-containing sensor histidine kinase [uncultured Paraglaciecola sp.]|uniref:sensor histidine kinase n=1 Tax=uncultured Paraglaciecola sp. TaxID=1765024 RepID=UPI0030DCC889|tara:strand:+ start:1606 stop:3105 length:1500 start_codon:yes stop_codon:yes gene_type:complete